MFLYLQNIKFVFLCTIVLNISLIERILFSFPYPLKSFGLNRIKNILLGRHNFWKDYDMTCRIIIFGRIMI